jgi:hypothetical protein
MMPTPICIRVAALILTLAPATAAAATPEEENEERLNKIVELNKKALLAYDALEIETASALLHQALNLCRSHGLENHPTAARTHLHLGVVYISGLKFPELGEAEFREALAIDPKIQVPKSLQNPEVEAAFQEALWWETGPKGSPMRLPFPTGQEAASAATQEGSPWLDRIHHPLLTHANRAQPIEIKAQVPPGMGAAKIVLAYMSQKGSEFLAREMTPMASMPSWFHEFIPVEATRGDWVAYYIEAQDAEDEPLANHGSAESPHQVTLVREGQVDQPAVGDQASAGKLKARDLGGRSIWFVFALGSGAGYHRGAPEMNPRDAAGRDIEVAGFGASQLLHVAPEIGYFHRGNLVLSAQGRFQYVTGTQEVRIGKKKYEPAILAFAGLVKATWLGGRPGNRFQPFVSIQAGAGQIRHTITTPESANLTGCSPDFTCTDTVLGGLALMGAGSGFRYHVSDGLGFYAAINLLAGVPHVMVNADLNLGLAIVR